MIERNIELKVGAFVLVAVGLFVGFVFTLGDYYSGEKSRYFIDFPTSADLKTGAPVKMAGVSVGKVESVDFWGGKLDPDTNRRVMIRVELSIFSEMAQALRQDAKAFISTLGILGEKYIELEPGTFDTPELAAGSVIIGEPPLRLELVARDVSVALGHLSELLRENRGLIHEILTNINKTVIDADNLIVDNQASVADLLSRLLNAAKRIDAVLSGLEKGIGDGSDIHATLENTQKVTSKIRSEIGPIMKKANNTLGAFDRTATTFETIGSEGKVKIFKTLQRVEQALESVAAIADKVREGRGTVGALLADQELYDDLKELLADLRRHPWKFIWKE